MKCRRLEKGLTQQQLAKAVGTTQSVIARLETVGENVSIERAVRIAEALDCELVCRLVPKL
jgi:UDP-N-acetylglucosamine 1-carboxyvinyltransferase